MYEMIRDELLREYEKQVNDACSYIDKTPNDLPRYLTPAKLRKFKAGEMSVEEATVHAKAKAEQECKKRFNKGLARVEQMEKLTSGVKSITLVYDFSRAGVCTATVDFYLTDGRRVTHTGKAGGWGYDKASSAVAEAFNKLPEMLKPLYDVKEASLQAGNPSAWSNESHIAYGAGYGALPYYEGGVGMSTVDYLLKKIGFKRTFWHDVDKGPTIAEYEKEVS